MNDPTETTTDTAPPDIPVDPMIRFDHDVAAKLGAESTVEDQIRAWYQERVPWAKMSGGDLGEEFRKWATDAMQTESNIRPNRHGWAVAALAVASQRTLRSAASACGMSERTLRRLISEKPAFAELVELAEQELVKGVAARRVALRTKAVARIERCLESDDDRIALRAAQLLAAGSGL